MNNQRALWLNAETNRSASSIGLMLETKKLAPKNLYLSDGEGERVLITGNIRPHIFQGFSRNNDPLRDELCSEITSSYHVGWQKGL